MTFVVAPATETDKSTTPDTVVTATLPSTEVTDEIPPELASCQTREVPSVPTTFPELVVRVL